MELNEALKILGLKKFNPNMDYSYHKKIADKSYREAASNVGNGSRKKVEQQLEIFSEDYKKLQAWERLCCEQQKYKRCPTCNRLTVKEHHHCPECNKIMQIKYQKPTEEILVEKYFCPACGHTDINIVD
jgi:RNA polymerase subunit RPABC4/transcription elongation factor Spt4